VIRIRAPLALRVYVAAFVAAWVALGAAAAHEAGRAAAIVPAVIVVAGLAFAWLLFRVRVDSDGDELVVRNHLRTQRLRRGEIEAFRLGRPSYQPFGELVYVLLRDGSVVALDATNRASLTGPGRRRLAARLDELRAWQAEGPHEGALLLPR
jgi:hypothetical protein